VDFVVCSEVTVKPELWNTGHLQTRITLLQRYTQVAKDIASLPSAPVVEANHHNLIRPQSKSSMHHQLKTHLEALRLAALRELMSL
jgi:hypothetical protein